MSEIDESVIKENEYHPAANAAMKWFRKWELDPIRYAMTREAIASTALSGDRNAQICNGTLNRLEKGEPVSDRYLLGLCWTLKELEDTEIKRSLKPRPEVFT